MAGCHKRPNAIYADYPDVFTSQREDKKIAQEKILNTTK